MTLREERSLRQRPDHEGNAFSLYSRECKAFDRSPSPLEMGRLKGLVEEYGQEWVVQALGQAAVHGRPANLAYVKGVLRRWSEQGAGPQEEPRSDFERRYMSGPYGRIIS